MKKILTTICFLSFCVLLYGQDTIPSAKIPTLNRIAEEYDDYKWVFGIAASVLAVWSFFGLKFFVKAKAEEWILAKIAKEADLKVEFVKAAVSEFGKIADLKKKKILVLSATEGQQGDLKKVFDGCGFANVEWENIAKLSGLVLKGVDLILLNDQPELRLTRGQIEDVFEKFQSNVTYQYFGPDNQLPVGEYRKKYPKFLLGLCNSADRLETGILSLLKIS